MFSPDGFSDDGTGFRGGSVHVPLDEIDLKFTDGGIDGIQDILNDFGATKIEHECVTRFLARSSGKMEDPVGVSAIEIGVGIDIFRLEPESKLHAEAVDFFGERSESVGECFGAGGPVSQAGVVVEPAFEPAVIDAEQFDADGGGFSSEFKLSFVIDIEEGGFPAVVEDGAILGFFVGSRCDAVANESVHSPACAAPSGGGAAKGECGGGVRFVRREGELEFEGVVAAVDDGGVVGFFLKSEAPVSAACELPEIDDAGFFGGLPGMIEQEEGIAFQAGKNGTAFKDGGSDRQDVALCGEFLAVAAIDVGEFIPPRRKVKRCEIALFDRDGFGAFINQFEPAFDHIALGGNPIARDDFEGLDGIFQKDSMSLSWRGSSLRQGGSG